MAEHERRPFPELAEGMSGGGRRPGWLPQAGEQEHRPHREPRGQRESRPGARPAHERAGQGGTAGERHRAGQLDPPVGRGQRGGRHEARHQSRRGHVVGDGATGTDEAEQRQGRNGEQPELGDAEDGQQGHDPQAFGRGHEPAARRTIGQHAGGNGEDQEGQRLGGLQPARLAGAGAGEGQDGHDGRRRQADLLGRLRRQIGPGQAVEGRWEP